MVYDVNGNPLYISEQGLPLSGDLSENLLIRHYGGNSASNLATAYTNGLKAVEGDVQFTSDKHPIMCHDASTGGLNISTHTLAELQAVATIYQLEDCLLDCKKYNLFLDVDFTKTYTEEQCQILTTIIKDYGMVGRSSIEVFVNSSAVTISSISHDYILNILGCRTTAAIDACDTFADKSSLIICTIPHEDATQELVEYAHNKGYLAKIWTGGADTKAIVEGYLDMGADQVLTDSVKPSDIVPT